MFTATVTFQSEPEWLVRVEIPGFTDKASALSFSESCRLESRGKGLILLSNKDQQVFDLRHQEIPERPTAPTVKGYLYDRSDVPNDQNQSIGQYAVMPGMRGMPYQMIGVMIGATR